MKELKHLKTTLLLTIILSLTLVSVTGCSSSKNTPLFDFEEDSDGNADGWGVCEFSDGTIYQGEMSHGYFEGLGLCLVPSEDTGDMIRAAEYIHSERPDTYNYAVEYYPNSGQVVFGQNEYDALDERWIVLMGDDPSIYCTVQCFTPDKNSKSGERERLRFDLYNDGQYEVVFTDDNGKQIDNSEIMTYNEDDGIELGYWDEEEEGIGIWMEDYGSKIVLASTIDSLFSCSGVLIFDRDEILVGNLDKGEISGIGIEYSTQSYFVGGHVDGASDGETLCCNFTENTYFRQEYDAGDRISSEPLSFPEGVSGGAKQTEENASESAESKEADSKTSDAAGTGKMWIVGEGESYIDSNANISQDKTSYAEQIDKIMKSFEDYNAAQSSLERHAPNASYRMFELLCVIAREMDVNGGYAEAVTESARNRYEETDATLEYGNLQIINSLYRCEEMLASIMYELGGEESIAEIEEIFANGPSEEVTVDNFLACGGDAMVAVYRYLYGIVPMLNLPDSNREEIQDDYELWQSDMQVVENESNNVVYSSGMRRYTGSLYRIYELLDQTVLGLDSSGIYAEEVRHIEKNVEDAEEVWKDGIEESTLSQESYYNYWDGALFDADTNLLGIAARLLDPDAS